jgi:RimJ/RimL family protein N-acetyltransferase
MDHARHGLGLTRITAIVSPANTPSISLLEKLGFEFEGMVAPPGEDKQICLYSIDWDVAG